jgi:hypothetical protein
MPYSDPVQAAACKRRHYDRNKAKVVARAKRWNLENPEKARACALKYRMRTKDRQKALGKLWVANNRQRVRDNMNRYKKMVAQTPEGRAIKSCRDRVYKALKRYDATKSARTIVLLGCTIPEFIAHIERQFTAEMNWSNHGTVWEIDHIRPVATFDLCRPEHQLACFHYTNCQPLPCFQNKSKGPRFVS